MQYIKAANMGIAGLLFYTILGNPTIEYQLFTFSMVYFVVLIIMKAWDLRKKRENVMA